MGNKKWLWLLLFALVGLLSAGLLISSCSSGGGGGDDNGGDDSDDTADDDTADDDSSDECQTTYENEIQSCVTDCGSDVKCIYLCTMDAVDAYITCMENAGEIDSDAADCAHGCIQDTKDCINGCGDDTVCMATCMTDTFVNCMQDCGTPPPSK